MSPVPDGGQGGTYSSIDTAAFTNVISSLQKTVDGISTLSGFADRFGEGGVSTTHLDKLKSFAPTISNLLPELRRRESLAQAMCAENPSYNGIASFTSDSLGAFTTTAAAQAQAKADAAKIKNGQIPDDVMADIKKYDLDPDYAEALVKEMGPDKLAAVLPQYSPLNKGMDDDVDDGDRQAVGALLATSSYRISFDYDHWMKPMAQQQMGNSFLLLTSYMKLGDKWSEQSLTNLANLRWKPKEGDYFFDDSSQRIQQQLLTGFTNNPGAAADYMSQNQDLLHGWMQNGMNAPDTDKAWAGFVHAATIDAKDQYGLKYLNDPGNNPAIKNAEYMMKHSGGDWSDPMHDTFAAMASVYMKDYARTIGSPIDVGSVTDPTYDGVSVGGADWQAFLKQAMHSNTDILTVASAFQQQINGYMQSGVRTSEIGRDGSRAAFWDNYTVGALQKTFVNLFNQTASDRSKDEADQEGAWDDLLDKGLDFALDPEGTLKDVGTDAVKGLIHMGVAAAVGKDPMPDMPGGFDTKKNFAPIADQFSADGKLNPFTEPIGNGQSITWDGKPDLYTHPSPPNGDFTQDKFKDPGTGHVDLDKLAKDPAAWNSYNQWLHDPSVQYSVSPTYESQLHGEEGQDGH